MVDKDRFNPLVLDPDNYEKLFDEDFLEDEPCFDKDQYEDVGPGARRKKPALDDL